MVRKDKLAPLSEDDVNGKWSENKIDQGYELALLGHTDKEMAKVWEVTPSTVERWKKDYPEFRKSVSNGRALADAKLAHALYKKCMGMWVEDEKVVVIKGVIHKVTVKRYIPPDTEAIKYMLGTRQRPMWSQRTEVTSNTNINITRLNLGDMSEQDLRLLRQVQEKYSVAPLQGLQEQN